MVTAMETSSDQGEMENSAESVKQEASGKANAAPELVSTWGRVALRCRSESVWQKLESESQRWSRLRPDEESCQMQLRSHEEEHNQRLLFGS